MSTKGVLTYIGSLGGADAYAYAMNDRGQVVGDSAAGSGEWHGFLWEKGTMTDLGTLGGTWSTTRAINASGQVVGVSTTASGDWRAVLWTK